MGIMAGGEEEHGRYPNVRAKLPSMLWVVVVLLRQCDDQLKIGFS